MAIREPLQVFFYKKRFRQASYILVRLSRCEQVPTAIVVLIYTIFIKIYRFLTKKHLFFLSCIHAIGFEDTDQEVADVIMSRSSCVLMVKQEEKGLVQYIINLDKYPSVKQISIWDDVDIFRGIADGKLYAFWSDSGLCVEIDR